MATIPESGITGRSGAYYFNMGTERKARAATLSAALTSVGYTEAGICRVLGVESPLGSSPPAILPIYAQRAADQPGLGDLIQLLFLSISVEAGRLAPILDIHDLVYLNLASVAGNHLVPQARVSPFSDVLVVHDIEGTAKFRKDHVLGVGPAARTLAGLTIRPDTKRALDLGTGSGIQALLLAAHVKDVTATDINARALSFAELNADLNGRQNIRFMQGDLFAPVAGEEFDLIVSNPPFVISPDNNYIFRDAGRPLDTLTREIIEQAPGFLREGCFAHIMCNWVCPSKEAWAQPIEQWVTGSGCDAWLLVNKVEDIGSYAAQWNDWVLRSDPQAYAEVINRWTRFYQSADVRHIAMGVVILRKRTGANWVRFAHMPYPPRGSASSHILRAFAAQDYLASSNQRDDLLDQVFRLVDNHFIDQRTEYKRGQYFVMEPQMQLEEGIGLHGTIVPLATHVLFRIDGSHTLRDLINITAEEAGLDKSALTEATLKTVWNLLSLGLLSR